jgi:hypothetical protein
MKKSLAGSVLFNALMIGIASAASKGVHFQKPLSAAFDYAALNNTINQIMQVLVAAIIVLILVLVQGIFFFIRDLTQRRRD